MDKKEGSRGVARWVRRKERDGGGRGVKNGGGTEQRMGVKKDGNYGTAEQKRSIKRNLEGK